VRPSRSLVNDHQWGVGQNVEERRGKKPVKATREQAVLARFEKRGVPTGGCSRQRILRSKASPNVPGWGCSRPIVTSSWSRAGGNGPPSEKRMKQRCRGSLAPACKGGIKWMRMGEYPTAGGVVCDNCDKEPSEGDGDLWQGGTRTWEHPREKEEATHLGKLRRAGRPWTKRSMTSVANEQSNTPMWVPKKM